VEEMRGIWAYLSGLASTRRAHFRIRGTRCEFIIKLRDDAQGLNSIRDGAGIGSVDPEKGEYKVQDIGDIVHVLIPQLEKCPHWKAWRKYREFKPWAQAAQLIYSGQHKTKEGSAELLRLKRELTEARKYRKPEGGDAGKLQ